jgi:hypothetical protein
VPVPLLPPTKDLAAAPADTLNTPRGCEEHVASLQTLCPLPSRSKAHCHCCAKIAMDIAAPSALLLWHPDSRPEDLRWLRQCTNGE